MRKLRVGVWISNDILPEAGGGFGYYAQLLEKLKATKFKEVEIIFISNDSDSIKYFKIENKYIIKWKERKIIKIFRFVLRKTKNLPFPKFTKYLSKHIDTSMNLLNIELNNVIDVIYYLTPDCIYPTFPYIYTLWDIGHLSMYAFPEVAMHGNYEIRKKQYDSYLNKAICIFTESLAGKQDAIKYLNINPDRIRVIPIFPSSIVDKSVNAHKPNIQEDLYFIHYPAQYWAHKNHYNLILAFNLLASEFPSLKLVLTGADKGNKSYIFSIIEQLHLSDKIIDLGFVTMNELKWIYLHSKGLVMPTFLGPTNMPLLEAAELNCPVACSNLEGHIEQLGDYAYYFDPLNYCSIYECVRAMLLNQDSLKNKQYNSQFNIDNAIQAIDSALTDLKNIRFCWN